MHLRLPDDWRKRSLSSLKRAGMARSARALAALALLAMIAAACSSTGSQSDKAGIGADCLSARDDGCVSDLCLVLDSSTAYCTQPCQAQADCPTGYLCLSSSLGSVCQARGAGGVCSVEADCPAGLQCDTSSARCYIAVTRSACGA